MKAWFRLVIKVWFITRVFLSFPLGALETSEWSLFLCKESDGPKFLWLHISSFIKWNKHFRLVATGQASSLLAAVLNWIVATGASELSHGSLLGGALFTSLYQRNTWQPGVAIGRWQPSEGAVTLWAISYWETLGPAVLWMLLSARPP